jgi:PAS domain S-box-containing protein
MGDRTSARGIIEELKRRSQANSSNRDQLSILHELSVYQEELVVQNEALTHAQVALEQTRDRFIELYDFAPSGYLTLDENGVIRETNLTAASLLGKSKQALDGMPLLGFVAPDDRQVYFDFLRRCRQVELRDIEAEISLQSADGVRRVQLLCRLRGGQGPSRECFTALIDITDRRMLERERDRNARERAALVSLLISAQDDERLRISRNLHDDMGQRVTALRLKFDAIASIVPKTADAVVTQLQAMLLELDERLHFVASDLRPAALDLGIVAALDQFIREWSETFGVPAVLNAGGIKHGTLAPHVETHLYRIAQEALNNTAKYASATRVTVLLERRSDGVVLMVEDDGRGFDLTESRKPGDGLGIVGMRERAQIVGARFELESAPGNGTSVFVHVPPHADHFIE